MLLVTKYPTLECKFKSQLLCFQSNFLITYLATTDNGPNKVGLHNYKRGQDAIPGSQGSSLALT